MNNQRFEQLLRKHADVISRTSRELAMNFDVPARSIIQSACADMGISEKTWRDLMSYQIAKEQDAVSERGASPILLTALIAAAGLGAVIGQVLAGVLR